MLVVNLKKRSAFTLIELLVVIAIAALLPTVLPRTSTTSQTWTAEQAAAAWTNYRTDERAAVNPTWFAATRQFTPAEGAASWAGYRAGEWTSSDPAWVAATRQFTAAEKAAAWKSYRDGER